MDPILYDELVGELNKLIQLDIDAAHAYGSAIDKVDLSDVRNRLVEFRADHERHVTDLSPIVRRLGGVPPAPDKPDFRGFLIHGFTALRSVTGTAGALKAMRTNEEAINRAYAKALAFEVPAEIRPIVERIRDDERRHLDYIDRCIADRVWDKLSAA